MHRNRYFEESLEVNNRMSWTALQIKWQECFRCVSDKIIIDWAVSPVLRGSDKHSVLVNTLFLFIADVTPHGGYEKEFKFHIHSGMRQSLAGGSYVRWGGIKLRIKLNTEVLARISLRNTNLLEYGEVMRMWFRNLGLRYIFEVL